jgi:chorismate mutase
MNIRRIRAIRREIDELDRKLVRLLSRRAEHSLTIGRAKVKEGLPLFHRKREQEIARNVAHSNPGPLSNFAIQHLWQEILQQTRAAVRRALRAESRRAATSPMRKGKG